MGGAGLSDEDEYLEEGEKSNPEVGKDVEPTAMTGVVSPPYVGGMVSYPISSDPSYTYPPFAPSPSPSPRIPYPTTTTTTVYGPPAGKKVSRKKDLPLPRRLLEKVLLAFIKEGEESSEDTIDWAAHMRLLDATISRDMDGNTIMTITLDMEDFYGDRPEED